MTVGSHCQGKLGEGRGRGPGATEVPGRSRTRSLPVSGLAGGPGGKPEGGKKPD